MSWLDFAHPWALVLAPVAVLPLWRPRTGLLTFSYISWLPPDRRMPAYIPTAIAATMKKRISLRAIA